ncbi:MAG: hypothetical protein ACRYG7_03815 [Janthinobacterium lividum]
MPPVSYHNRTFKSASSSANGEVSEDTIFRYQQADEVVTATYAGGDIRQGMLLARADALGRLNMRYQHLNHRGELMTGTCQTVPELLPDGRLRLHETWQWTSGDCSSGASVLEEIR